MMLIIYNPAPFANGVSLFPNVQNHVCKQGTSFVKRVVPFTNGEGGAHGEQHIYIYIYILISNDAQIDAQIDAEIDLQIDHRDQSMYQSYRLIFELEWISKHFSDYIIVFLTLLLARLPAH